MNSPLTDSEAAGARYLAHVLDDVLAAPPPKPRPIPDRAFQIDVDISAHFVATVVYTMDGETHAATETSPGEYPQPTILSCHIGCGAWKTEATFNSLATAVREQILDECREEASWR